MWKLDGLDYEKSLKCAYVQLVSFMYLGTVKSVTNPAFLFFFLEFLFVCLLFVGCFGFFLFW